MTAGKPQTSLNSLIYEICRGAVWKKGATVVTGILDNADAISVIASIGRPVLCYDTRASRVKSRLTNQLSAFALPPKPRNAEFFIDNKDPLEGVAVLFLLSKVEPPCMSFLPGATIVGDESSLREALKGHKFFPRAYFRDLAAMEIQ